MEEEDNENFLEDAEYSSKSDFSKAEVVKLQVQKCNEIRSKEMKEGFFNYDRFGNKIYIPDARKEWVSSVIALMNLLSPEIFLNKNKIIKKGFINEEEKKLLKEFGIEIGEGKKIIPMLDESFPTTGITKKNNYSSTKRREIMIKGLYNGNFHRYWDSKVLLYDKLYSKLNILIHENNYFKQEVSY